MEGASLFGSHSWTPFAQYGLTGNLFTFNADTLIFTWVTLALLLIGALAARWALNYPGTLVGHLSLTVVKSFATMVEQSTYKIVDRYVYFIGGLFLFIFTCNAIVLLPGMEEPTKDINTTLALGIIAFCYAQKEAIYAHGLKGYIEEYVKMPFSLFPEKKISVIAFFQAIARFIANIVLALFSLPLEILGKAATVVSLALRLLGNIFGGAMITGMFKQAIAGSFLFQTIALLSGINLIIALFFGLFEAVIQAFVFAILSLTYITMGISSHD